ncbi:hypothetical protein ACFFX0_08305 [Citricoccus parietis]|uniref:Secreted protein n=1 Tax=Citricoccus parietis TaxID=592307 RepID=A0ABV5FX02_9MICC
MASWWMSRPSSALVASSCSCSVIFPWDSMEFSTMLRRSTDASGFVSGL